ncbi:MAG: hypothetical protein ACRC1Y_02025 [Paraclostridium sp.]
MKLQSRTQISSVLTVGLFLGILSFLVSVFWEVPLFPVLVWICPIWILIGLNTKYFDTKKSQILFILIMLIKFLLMIYQAKYKNLPMGGNDWLGYDTHALNLLAESKNIIDILFNGDVNFFSRIMSIIYYFFGTHIQLINCLVLITSILQINYIYKIGKLFISDESIISKVLLISAILPINFIFSITVLRETPIQLFFIMSLYYIIEYFKNSKFKNFIYAIITSIIATMLHSGMIVIPILYIGLYMSYSKKTKEINFNIISIVAITFVIIALFLSGLLNPLLDKFNGIENINDILVKGQYVAGNTAYINKTPNNILELIMQTPYRFFMFSLVPFPWQVRDIGTIIALIIDAIPQYFIMYFTINYIMKIKCEDSNSRNIKIVMVGIFILVYIMFGWGTANFGTAMRHRSKISPMMILIAGKFIEYKKKKCVGNDHNE